MAPLVNPCRRRGFSFVAADASGTIRPMRDKPRRSDSDCSRCGGRDTVAWGHTERRCRNCGDTYKVNHARPPCVRVIVATLAVIALFWGGLYEAHRRGWLKPFIEAFEIAQGDAYRFRPGTVHRVTAVEDTLVIEVSTNHLTDVVRLEDRYGRQGTNAP